MTTANIDTVVASLRSCSLAATAAGGNSGDPSPQQAGGAGAGEITVDIHSDSALPCHWEQHLDMQTGEIYYINRETGFKTREDPRTAAATAYSSSDDDDDEDVTSDEYSCLSHNGSSDDYDDEEKEEEEEDSDTGDGSSSASSASPPHPSVPAQVLVAAGCKGCFLYFMVPKHVDACPKCGGGGLLHLGRNGCI